MDRIARMGLRYTQFHSTALCSQGGANHWAQSPLSGVSGLRFVIGPENATIGTILQQNGYATSWFGKSHNTPSNRHSAAGPFDQWPVDMGFDYFYGILGGESDQWTPHLFQNMTQIFPWIGKPGYNLTTDMADEAIARIIGRGAKTWPRIGPMRTRSSSAQHFRCGAPTSRLPRCWTWWRSGAAWPRIFGHTPWPGLAFFPMRSGPTKSPRCCWSSLPRADEPFSGAGWPTCLRDSDDDSGSGTSARNPEDIGVLSNPIQDE
jgi:hypothetical protein